VRPLIVLTLIALLPCLIVGQTDKKAQKTAVHNVEAELEKLDDEAEEAASRGDASFFEKFLSDDYTGVGATGHTSTKDRTVEFVRSGKLKFETWKINDRKIRIFGDAAVITQEEQYTNAYSGATDISGTYRVTLILVKTENGQWQELVWQSTKEQETKAP
jgi:hypothetical protein